MLISDLQSISCRYIQSYLKLNEVNSVFNPFEDQSVFTRARINCNVQKSSWLNSLCAQTRISDYVSGEGSQQRKDVVNLELFLI